MSIISCLLKKAELGKITKKTAEDVSFLLNSYKEKIQAGATDLTSEMEVAEKAFNIVQQRLAQRTRQVTIHADVLEKTLARIDEQYMKGIPLKKIVESMNVGSESSGFKYGYMGENGTEVIQGTQQIYESMLTEAFDSLKNKGWFGVFRSSKLNKEVIKDMFAAVRGQGSRSENEAVRTVTDAFKKVSDLGAKDFERAGGSITARSDFILGRHDDVQKLATHGLEAWLADIKPLLSTRAIIDVFPEAADPKILDNFLREVYNYQISGGLSEIGDYVPKGLRSVVNLRNHHRIIDFKDADSYIKYHEKYGDMNIYGHMQNYASKIGRDIGTLNFYGPKPEALLNAVKRKLAELNPTEAASLVKTFERQYRNATGLWDRTTDPVMARTLANFRAANTAGKLNSTVIDALLGETPFLSTVARSIRGIPTMKALAQDAKLFLKPGNLNKEYKQWAKMALYNEAFIDEAATGMRANEAEGADRVLNIAASAAMKYSGLTRKTHTTKASSILTLGFEWADQPWENLGKNGQVWLGQQGITKEMYENIRLKGSEEYDLGVNIISPAKLYEEGLQKEAVAVASIYRRAAEASSPTSTPQARAFFADLERAGKAPQFLVGSLKTFQGYNASFWENHFKVLMNLPGAGKKASYAGAYVLALMSGGILSQLVRDVKDGKKPKLDEDLVMRAMKRSNIFPFITDFIISGGGSYNKGLYDSLAGATLDSAARAASGAIKLGVQAPYALLGGDEKKAKQRAARGTEDILKVIQGFIPGQNHWATGLAFQRLIMDQLKMLYDPNSAKSFKRRIREQEKREGGYWWAPGEIKPKLK